MDHEDETHAVAKPEALLALHEVTAELFDTLRDWFGVPTHVRLDLAAVDSACAELADPTMVAAVAMRKLQALHLLATPGVVTSTDVVVAIVNDLDRALVQAPAMRLKVQAAGTDWDAALVALRAVDGHGAADHPSRRAPGSPDEDDPVADRFADLHERLHQAMYAVIAASDGEIRYLI